MMMTCPEHMGRGCHTENSLIMSLSQQDSVLRALCSPAKPRPLPFITSLHAHHLRLKLERFPPGWERSEMACTRRQSADTVNSGPHALIAVRSGRCKNQTPPFKGIDFSSSESTAPLLKSSWTHLPPRPCLTTRYSPLTSVGVPRERAGQLGFHTA